MKRLDVLTRLRSRRSRDDTTDSVPFLARWFDRRSKDALGGDRYIIQKSDFGIRLADLHTRIQRVETLVTRMYQMRGYRTQQASPAADEVSCNLHRVTLEARGSDKTIGTITVNLDSPEGLLAEDLYRKEIAQFRLPQTRLCEFTRLALDVEGCGKEALGNLFHLAFIFAYRIHRATDLFIEVNPRHALFYRRKLGFTQVGEQKTCRRVDAPAVLLHRKLSSIAEEITRYGGLKLRENKSFYSFFMPPWEEKELLEEIKESLAKTELRPAPQSSAKLA